MKVVLLGNLSNINVLLVELGSHLRAQGLDIHLVDFFSSQKYDFDKEKLAPLSDLSGVKFLLLVPFLRLLIKKQLASAYISNLQSGDIVNVHYVSPFYIPFARRAVRKGVKWISTIWGSDYMRVDSKTKLRLLSLFEVSDKISMVHGLQPFFLNEYPQLKDKVTTTFFGLSRIEVEVDFSVTESIKQSFHIPQDKVAVCIGNNASPAQQHEKVLNSLDAVVNKDNYHIILPMTYGGNQAYKENIRQLCEKGGFTYSIIDRRLSDNELVSLQDVIDVILFFQKSDAFSAFLCETIYRGAMAIVGDWLPYSKLGEWGVTYISTSIDRLEESLQNQKLDKLDSNLNTKIIYNSLSWNSVLSLWQGVYAKK